MTATPEEIINIEANKGLENLIDRVELLESNDYYRPAAVVGVTSNPPTDAELDSLLGTPASFNGNIVALVEDTTNSRYWIVFGNTTNWFTIAANLAT